jgi:histone acetyltransferase (RNA polymerase elongator complex component)
MRRSRPTASGSGVIVAVAIVALLLTAHSCSGGGCGTCEQDVRTRCGQTYSSGGRLDEIGRDCPNPERINVVPRRCGGSRGLGLC